MATLRLCSIPDCGKPHLARGWCVRHYKRWIGHGDPLGGRQANGAAQKFVEEVIYNYQGEDCLTWPFTRNAAGYGMWDKTIVSRIACERINGPAPTSSHEAAHLCGKGHTGCVNMHHLAWKTHSENIDDKAVHGTTQVGGQCSWAKLSKDQVREIRRIGREQTQAKLARQYGVSQATISEVLAGLRYATV